MVAAQYFIAKDYLRAFDLQNLFHSYAVYYTQLHCPDNDVVLSSKDRDELNLKLEQSLNDLTLLVLEMKQAKSDKTALRQASLPVFSAPNQITECRMAH